VLVDVLSRRLKQTLNPVESFFRSHRGPARWAYCTPSNPAMPEALRVPRLR
jgi:hypothetical protein